MTDEKELLKKLLAKDHLKLKTRTFLRNIGEKIRSIWITFRRPKKYFS